MINEYVKEYFLKDVYKKVAVLTYVFVYCENN